MILVFLVFRTMMTTMMMMMMMMMKMKMKKKKKKRKKEKRKRGMRKASGRIGEVPLVVETVGVDSGVGVVIVVKIEEASVVVGEASVVAVEAFVVVGEVSVVAAEASAVAEGASGIVMARMALEGGGEVSGVGVVEEEIGEDLGRVSMVTSVREILEVKRSEESRRRGLSSGEKKNIEFEAEMLKVSICTVIIV
jgi:uncharacterized membrane protein YeiB